VVSINKTHEIYDSRQSDSGLLLHHETKEYGGIDATDPAGIKRWGLL